MKTYIVDANLILRFLTGAPESQATLAAEFFQNGEDGAFAVSISPIVVAETVFVLTGKTYGCSREVVSDQLTRFLTNPAFCVEDSSVLLDALRLFGEKNVDFVDAYLAADALASGTAVASFDRDFRKFDGLDLMLLAAE